MRSLDADSPSPVVPACNAGRRSRGGWRGRYVPAPSVTAGGLERYIVIGRI